MTTNHTDVALFRLSNIIREHYEREGRSYPGVARAIAEANGNTSHGRVDRRKLALLAEGESVPLSFDELGALNNYLIQKQGVGLGSIFPNPTLTEALTSRRRVTFLLGAKHREGRTAMSLWDFRCMEWMVRRIYRAAPMTQVDFIDLPMPVQGNSGLSSKGETATQEIDDWTKLMDDPQGPSLICFGSQRVCPATEVLMRRMFNIDPFAPVQKGAPRCPFAFVWSQAQPDEFGSSFSTSPSVIEQYDWRVDAKDWRTWGIHLWASNGADSQTLKVCHSGLTGRSFGVILAQRRPYGQVWLVLAGLSGPETFAGAKVIDSIIKALPPSNGATTAPVLWALFEATVRESPGQKIGDNRTLTSQKLLSQNYWPPELAE